jgi:hypothetical protein
MRHEERIALHKAEMETSMSKLSSKLSSKLFKVLVLLIGTILIIACQFVSYSETDLWVQLCADGVAVIICAVCAYVILVMFK